MQIPDIPLFNWLIEYLPKTKIDLANSSITSVKLSDLLNITGFEIPDDLDLGKNDPFGALELREVLAKNYRCKPDNVVTTTGGSEANFITFLALLEPDDEVIVEKPGYSPLWLVPQMLGGRIIPWERRFEDNFALDLESLKDKISRRTKLIVITNLHNPSGIQTDQKTINAIADLAAENNAFLFVDEMFLDAANEPQISAVGHEAVIVTASVSKIYGIGGLRTGWIIAQEDIIKKCLSAKWQASVASPYFSEIVVSAALSKAQNKLIDRHKSIAQQNFPIVKAWIEKHENLVDWVPPEGGILCFPKFHAYPKVDSESFGKQLINEKGVLISPGKFFDLDGHFRLTFMNTKDELQTGLESIIDVLKTIENLP